MAYGDYTEIIDQFIRELTSALNEAVNLTSKRKIAREINRLNKLRATTGEKLDKEIIKELRLTYNNWIQKSNNIFAAFGDTLPPSNIKDAILFNSFTDYSADTSNILNSLNNQTQAVIRKTAVNQQFTKTVQANLEKFADQTTITSEQNIRAMFRSRILRDQARNVTQGKIIIKGRTYNYRKYLRLVQKVQLNSMQNEIQLQRTLKTGVRLIQINTTGTGDFCIFYEGRVFALGRSLKYPSVSQLPNFPPPWHPNCLHTFEPYIEPEDQTPNQFRESRTPRLFLKKPFESRDNYIKRVTQLEKVYVKPEDIQVGRDKFAAGTLKPNFKTLQDREL